MGYAVMLTNGDVVCGHTVNTLEYTMEGHLRLCGERERFGPHAAAGVFYVDEVG
ncbi:hypothetical protein [Lentzea sp. NPDC055074]